MSEESVFRMTVFFSGRVQGVGFRYQTVQVAQEFEVSGYVRNLMDGRVECLAEGDAAQVRAFMDEVAARLDVYIRKVERQEAVVPPSCKGFTIRH